MVIKIREIEFSTVEEFEAWRRLQEGKETLFAEGVAAVEPATPEDKSQALKEFIMGVLTRKTISRGQWQLYQALYKAGDEGLRFDVLEQQMGREGQTAGIVAALQKRIKYTPGADQPEKIGRKGYLELLFDIKPLGGRLHYRMIPELRECLKTLGIEDMPPVG